MRGPLPLCVGFFCDHVHKPRRVNSYGRTQHSLTLIVKDLRKRGEEVASALGLCSSHARNLESKSRGAEKENKVNGVNGLASRDPGEKTNQTQLHR